MKSNNLCSPKAYVYVRRSSKTKKKDRIEPKSSLICFSFSMWTTRTAHLTIKYIEAIL